jgi:hypothetical protein
MYDEKHRFIDAYDLRNEKCRFRQKGFSEPLLCRDCEARFARYERHSRRIFVDPLPAPRAGAERFFDLPNVDVSKLRYFLLSILWRSGVARSEMFAHVDLGEKHAEILRCHLLEGQPPPYDQYGCFVSALHHDGAPMKDVVVEPTYCRVDGHKVYRFVFAGIVLYCFVTGHPVAEKWRRLFLGYSDRVTIYRSDLPALRFMRELWFGR